MARPEPHVLLFRRLLGTDPVTGRVSEAAAEAARKQIAADFDMQQEYTKLECK